MNEVLFATDCVNAFTIEDFNTPARQRRAASEASISRIANNVSIDKQI